jgi:histidyl-tRNA synthetase
MSSKEIQGIRGMNDVLPEEAPLWEFFETASRELLRAYGYREIRIPVVERTDLFVRSIGEATDIVEKEMYSFQDTLNGEELTLRPEGTAGCVRAVVEHNLIYKGPQRLWYSGPMFRHERPQRGRYRQFHQIGVEAFGFTGPDVDAEHIVMCSRLWRNLGLQDITLQLNTLGSPEARREYKSELVRYFQSHSDDLDDDSRRRLNKNPLRILDSKNPDLQPLIQNAPRFLEHMDLASLNHFDGLKNYLSLNDVQFQLNSRLVRGLDYYNGTVFEWTTQELGSQGAICAGGRYDGLVSQLGGQATPACGFAIGVERVIELLKTHSSKVSGRALDVYIVRQGHEADKFSWNVAEQLRNAGLSVILHCGGGNVASQMRRADSSGARCAVIIGDDEATARMISVKPLRREAPQVRVSIDEAVRLVRQEEKPVTGHQSRVTPFGK